MLQKNYSAKYNGCTLPSTLFSSVSYVDLPLHAKEKKGWIFRHGVERTNATYSTASNNDDEKA